ncbi:uncharacterized protein LOC135213383 [Macrobrachium nipponense]|uniref:uncharacterized protein LOC135213383 n=1 Tax=Macrobrachium nipponense TaxID=159736 RepID=UPI0030C8736A
MASSAPVISSDDLQNVRRSLFVRKYGKKVVHLIYTFHFLHGQHRSIREILTDNQVPLQGRRCPFNDQDIRNLTEKLPEDLDITLMNKICQALWQKGVNDPGDELKGLLKKIKDERNFVSHEETQMSGPELESKLRGFQATLEETLEKIKALFPSHGPDTDQLNAEIRNAVPKLLEKIREKYDPSNPQDVQRFKDEIGDFGSEVYEMIQESFAKELRSLNERLCQILPYDWLADHGTTDPVQIMVPLQVTDDPELNRGPRGNKSIIVNQKEILNIKDPMGKDPEVVIISGDAGSGKTTILCSYAEGWCKNTNDVPELSSFPFLFCMQFRNHDHDSFDGYLYSLIPQTVAIYPFDLVKSVVLDSKCLVLCDGYDEANKNSRKLFQEFLKLNSNKMKFVVTTRPGNTEGLTNIVNKAKRSRINLRVSGLQEEDMKSLTEKLIGHLLKDDVTQQEQMKKELLQKIKEMNTGTRAILQTPLYFNLFVLLYIECPDLRDEMSTRTSVYLQLRRHKIKRISDKTGISEESLEEFDVLYREWCLKHYLERKYEYSEADVRNFKREISSLETLQNFDAIMSSYFSIKKTKKHLDIVNVYCHRHRSEQEFAAAGSICDDIVTSNRRTQGGNILLDVLRSKEFWDGSDLDQLFTGFAEVIPFIPGILNGTERDVFYDTIDEIHELYVSYNLYLSDENEPCELFKDIFPYSNTHDALLDPCIETRLDDKVLESLVSQMKRHNHMRDKVSFEEPKSLYVLPSLLPKLIPKEIELKFQYSNVTVSQLNETLKSAVNNNVNTKVSLTMDLSECAQLPGQEEEEEVLSPMDELRKAEEEEEKKKKKKTAGDSSCSSISSKWRREKAEEEEEKRQQQQQLTATRCHSDCNSIIPESKKVQGRFFHQRQRRAESLPPKGTTTSSSPSKDIKCSTQHYKEQGVIRPAAYTGIPSEGNKGHRGRTIGQNEFVSGSQTVQTDWVETRVPSAPRIPVGRHKKTAEWPHRSQCLAFSCWKQVMWSCYTAEIRGRKTNLSQKPPEKCSHLLEEQVNRVFCLVVASATAHKALSCGP